MPGKIATRDEWEQARLALFAKEKELQNICDSVDAQRRELPWVPVTKEYQFDGPDGPVALKDLFGEHSQLIIYHYMFSPTADKGCSGCAYMVANFPSLDHLTEKDTALSVVSRAPIDKIAAFKKHNEWDVPWVSSYGSDFNYDFQATIDEEKAPVKSKLTAKADLEALGLTSPTPGEQPGINVFKLHEGQVYHTYSNFGAIDRLGSTFVWLNLTPSGRDEAPNGPAEFSTPAERGQKDGNKN